MIIHDISAWQLLQCQIFISFIQQLTYSNHQADDILFYYCISCYVR